MPSVTHEGLIALFRNRPQLALELLRDALHLPIPDDLTGLRVADSNLSALQPTEYRADLVLLLPRLALIVEVQRKRALKKRWSWPEYLTNLRARLKRSVLLLLVTDDASMVQWLRQPIPTGHPGFVLTPLVLGPNEVPVITDRQVALTAPELAVLSAMAHGHSERATAIGEAAMAAAAPLDDERAGLYLDLILISLNDTARSALEALMNQAHEYKSDFAKRYVSQGREEGREEGRTEQQVEAILTVLAARGLIVSDAVQGQIAACEDRETLDTWLKRAVTAATAEDILTG